MRDAGKVLIVDPDAGAAALVELLLGRAGFSAASVCSAAAAILLGALEPPDVILLSLGAGSAGLEGLARLRAAPALARASIALTAGPGHGAHALGRALDLGADDCWRLPLDPVELVARTRALLRARGQLAQLSRETVRLTEINAHLEGLVIRDSLTGLHNRRYLEQRLAEEIERSRRYGQPLSLVVLDVDLFKKVNDTHGHVAGDAVLREIASIVQQTVRRVDLLARFGGEEFVVVAPATETEAARIMAERIRVAVEQAKIFSSSISGQHAVLRVTASFGVASLAPGDTLGQAACEELITAADTCLYRAKEMGRNRVEAS